MQLVIDSNILLAALIRSAITRNLLLDERLDLISPEHLLLETSKHIKEDDDVRSKILISDSELDELLLYLMQRIVIKPKESYKFFIDEAIKIAPHEKDAPFIALALSLNCPIWSNDRALKRQFKVKVLSTEEIIKFLQISF